MRLPRSFEEVKRTVTKYQAGVPTIFSDPQASAAKMAGGTRAGIAQGTSSRGNTPNPLVPGQSMTPGLPIGWDDPMETPPIAVFSTEQATIPNPDRTIVQTRDWPPNPSRQSISAPGERVEQTLPSGGLNSGPPPGRIMRFLPLRVFGVASQSTGQQGGEGFPWNGDMGYVMHVPIPRKALGTKGPQKLSDDGAAVPAIYAGNPR